MKKLFVVLLLLLCVGYFSCKHTPPEVVPETPPIGGGGTGGGVIPICFEADILPIFQSNCAKSNCHDAASHEDGYVFDSYANIVKKGLRPYNAADSKIYEVLFDTDPDDRMPLNAPPLTDTQKNLIGRWINEGAKNTTNCGTACDPTKFTYAANVQPILQTHCIGCHSGSSPAGGINLSNYNQVRSVALSGLLVHVINHDPGYKAMPMGAAKLSDCKIQQITKWVQAGALNN